MIWILLGLIAYLVCMAFVFFPTYEELSLSGLPSAQKVATLLVVTAFSPVVVLSFLVFVGIIRVVIPFLCGRRA